MNETRQGKLFRFWLGEQPEEPPEGWVLVTYQTLRGYGGHEVGKVPIWKRRKNG